jgi:hypothetical protein
MHWGLQVGPYLWELAADKKAGGKIVKNCLHQAEWWKPSLGPEPVGYGTWTDAQIDHCGEWKTDMTSEESSINCVLLQPSTSYI